MAAAGHAAVLLAALLACLLTACAVAPPAPGPDPDLLWRQREPRLQALTDWTLNGRVAVAAEGRSWNLRVHWVQRGTRFEIDLLSPLGQRLAELEGEPGGIELRRPGEEPARAASAEDLLEATFGWSAPVASLRYWVRGLPGAATTRPDLDRAGRVQQLTERGWRVSFQRYTEVDGIELPAKLRLESRDRSVRLVVDDWQIGAPSH